MRLIAVALALVAPPVAAAPISYRCSFPKVITIDRGLQDQDFAFTLAYDSVTKTAAMIGNNGVSTLQVYSGPDATSFLEFVATGAVQTLTMLPSGAAVYSRHTLWPGDDGFVASQQYGSCKP